jgi:hypothetical protein
MSRLNDVHIEKIMCIDNFFLQTVYNKLYILPTAVLGNVDPSGSLEMLGMILQTLSFY